MGIFPDAGGVLRLVASVRIEINDEWQAGGRPRGVFLRARWSGGGSKRNAEEEFSCSQQNRG